MVHDAWSHGLKRYTATGVVAKSSNVGTLMTAQRLGPDLFYDYLRRFGLGSRTGVELPAESPGLLLPVDKWSGSTFGNLPIGQGVGMTILQMAGKRASGFKMSRGASSHGRGSPFDPRAAEGVLR